MTDLNHIVLFARVVEAGSFSAAARALGVPKATVSRNVAQLEESLGARLLQRTTRRVELTALGRAYYEEAARGLSSLESARERIAAAQIEPSGTLRVTAPVAVGSRKLIVWIAEFLELHRKVRIELKLTDAPVDPIEERADVSIRTGQLPNSSLIVRKLGSSPRILLASAGYLEKRGVPGRIEDLPRHDCIVFGPSLDSEVWRLRGPNGWRDVPVTGRIAVYGSHAEVQAALAGLGIALLPTALVSDYLRSGRLQQVLPNYGGDVGTIHAVYPSHRHMPMALRAFLDFVTAKVADQAGKHD
ncbi:MAG: LysR family transcriptional regulator [Alphaproteobacteria bacterium]